MRCHASRGLILDASCRALGEIFSHNGVCVLRRWFGSSLVLLVTLRVRAELKAAVLPADEGALRDDPGQQRACRVGFSMKYSEIKPKIGC